MKRELALIALITFVFLSVLSPALSFAQSVTTDPGWPRMFESNGNEVVIYQPQLDQWDNHEKLHGKAAVADFEGEDRLDVRRSIRRRKTSAVAVSYGGIKWRDKSYKLPADKCLLAFGELEVRLCNKLGRLPMAAGLMNQASG